MQQLYMSCSSCSRVQPASTIAASFSGNSSNNTRKCPIFLSLSLPGSYIIHLHPGVKIHLRFILSPGTQAKQPQNFSTSTGTPGARPVRKPAHKKWQKGLVFYKGVWEFRRAAPGRDLSTGYPQFNVDNPREFWSFSY